MGKEVLDELERLIGKNDLSKAIKMLLDIPELKEDRGDILALQSRLSRVEKDKLGDTKSSSVIRKEYNKITIAVAHYRGKVSTSSEENFKALFKGIWIRVKWNDSAEHHIIDDHYIDFKTSSWTDYTLTAYETRLNFNEDTNLIKFIFNNAGSVLGDAIIRTHRYDYNERNYPVRLHKVYIDYDSPQFNWGIIHILDSTSGEDYRYIKVADVDAFESFKNKAISETIPEGPSWEDTNNALHARVKNHKTTKNVSE